MIRRREFITLLGGAAAWPLAARGQQPAKVPRIGYLSPGSASAGLLSRDEAFRQGLRDLGYVEGRNIVIEDRFAEAKFDRLAGLAAELVRLEGCGGYASVSRSQGCDQDDPHRHGGRF